MRLLVGLGNPGLEYAKTRHNAGFWLVEAVAEALQAGKGRSFAGGLLWEGGQGEQKCLLFEPQTFMNRSGMPIREVLQYFDILPEEVCIAADDVYIEPGSVRIRRSGSGGGHNGWKSVLEQVKPDTFWRVRIGVGLYEQHPARRMEQPPLDRYVLERQSVSDHKKTLAAIDRLVPDLLHWLEHGVLEEVTLHM